MGVLIDGVWHEQASSSDDDKGRFIRDKSRFRHWVTADGRAGPSGEGGFAAAPGRYHLYISTACPWSHRTAIFRCLKGLQDLIGLSVVNPYLGAQGWSFTPGRGVIADPVHQVQHLHQLYTQAAPDYSGRVTVPVLWDKQTDTLVSNESGDIIRMFNSAFDGVGAAAGDYYPADLRAEIDALNETIYHGLNNGVYRAGFATTQQAYEEAVLDVFETLNQLEQRLAEQRYLLGERMTEADWRLFVTLIRFDSVYHGHFKCNIRRLADFPHLSHYLRELYQWPGIAETVDLGACKLHYYQSHRTINPSGIVPVGPALDLTAAHDRGRFQRQALAG